MKRHPWVAGILNLILPGTGYLYANKRIFLGITLLLFFGSTYYSIFFLPQSSDASTSEMFDTFSSIVYLLLLLAFSYDAYEEVTKEISKSK